MSRTAPMVRAALNSNSAQKYRYLNDLNADLGTYYRIDVSTVTYST